MTEQDLKLDKPYRILVCGSRHFEDRDLINRVLDAQYAKIGPRMLLVTGGAVGADELARQWATSRKCDHIVLYAKWEVEGKAAGPIRNGRMLRLKPKKVFAFKVRKQGENRGTDNMLKIAQGGGVKTKEFYS